MYKWNKWCHLAVVSVTPSLCDSFSSQVTWPQQCCALGSRERSSCSATHNKGATFTLRRPNEVRHGLNIVLKCSALRSTREPGLIAFWAHVNKATCEHRCKCCGACCVVKIGVFTPRDAGRELMSRCHACTPWVNHTIDTQDLYDIYIYKGHYNPGSVECLASYLYVSERLLFFHWEFLV